MILKRGFKKWLNIFGMTFMLTYVYRPTVTYPRLII